MKESRELHGGEEITLIFPQREIRLRVLVIPGGNVSKRDAPSCYELLEDRARSELF